MNPIEKTAYLVLTSTLSSVVVPPTMTTPVVPPSIKNSKTVIKKALKLSNVKKSYVQASRTNILLNIEDVLQIKEVFPSLSANKVRKMMKAKNGSEGKKFRVNMTTREPSRKQVIIPMVKLNAKLIINSANLHISNVNKCLKKPANASDLTMIEKYLKNIQSIDLDLINSSCLLKSKSYLKIIGLPHMAE